MTDHIWAHEQTWVPAMTARDGTLTTSRMEIDERAPSNEVAEFLARARKGGGGGNGRLIFAMDATMSRQPTWDRALHVQGAMFDAAGKAGNLEIQLVYFRGYGECRASRWAKDAAALQGLMSGIDCRGGRTQIGKVLKHAAAETGRQRVSALVFVGDAAEEKIDLLCDRAGELGMKGVPCFMFQEGRDAEANRAFSEIARLTKGVHAKLDSTSPHKLAELLGAAAAFASGGLTALAARDDAGGRLLLSKLKK